MPAFVYRDFADLRAALLARREVALVDVREEAEFAASHPLFAVNIPLSKLELEAYRRIPRRATPITLYDNGDGLAEQAARRLQQFGYRDVALLTGGLAGWQAAGGELFQDVNTPSKAFGELVESRKHTPSLSAQQVKALIDRRADVAIVDVRRFDEYQTMSIPTSTSVPGAELVLRINALAPNPSTQVIVNCAGRTRSIIGAQSLINAGVKNPVAALRNGTIGWLLAGLALESRQQRRYPDSADNLTQARRVADAAGVRRIDRETLGLWRQDAARTTYLFDVRSPEEYRAGHFPGSDSAAGGQLVQETDHYASVRGARVVLVDDDGVRANMSASWLAQMGWETAVLDGLAAADFTERGDPAAPVPPPPEADEITPAQLAELLAQPGTVLLDFTTSANFVARHIPGAYWVIRSRLAQALETPPPAERYVLTCGSSQLARYAVPEAAALTGKPVQLLAGGTRAWIDENRPLEKGEARLAAPRIDRYRRPYEGTDSPREAMQAYLDWEFGLVEQLERDATHGFNVL